MVGESSRSEEESGCLAPLACVPDILLQQEFPLVSVDAGDTKIGYLGMKTRVPKAITVIFAHYRPNIRNANHFSTTCLSGKRKMFRKASSISANDL